MIGDSPGDPPAPEYLAEHLRTAFATDRRVHEQGLEVTIIGKTIVVRGTVSTPGLRDAVDEVARDVVPGADVVNDVDVPPNVEPDGVEELDR